MKAGYDKYSLTFCSTINMVYNMPKIQIVDHKRLEIFLFFHVDTYANANA